MFDIGWTEMLVIAIVMIVVVGPKDLPKMLRTFGKTTAKVRAMAGDFQRQFNEALREAELDDVKESVDQLRSLNPANEIRKQLNPFEKAAADIRAGVDAALKPSKPPEPASPAAQPAEPLKNGATDMPGVAGPDTMPAAPVMTPLNGAAAAPAAAPAVSSTPAPAATSAAAPATAKPASNSSAAPSNVTPPVSAAPATSEPAKAVSAEPVAAKAAPPKKSAAAKKSAASTAKPGGSTAKPRSAAAKTGNAKPASPAKAATAKAAPKPRAAVRPKPSNDQATGPAEAPARKNGTGAA